MITLSNDTYISIKFAMLIACLLSTSFTIITQKISFRQKTNLILLLIIIFTGLLIYLDSIYNKCNFFSYTLSIISYIWYSYTPNLKILSGKNLSDCLQKIIIFMLFNAIGYYLICNNISHLLEKNFKKRNNIDSLSEENSFPIVPAIFEFAVFMLAFGILLFLVKDVSVKILSNLSYLSYIYIFFQFIINYIILYLISGLIKYIGYRYWS